jgi:hypothetical protein
MLKWNKKGYMKSKLFAKYMTQLNKMMRQNRKILVFDNNAPHNVTFKNVTCVLFPTTTTAMLQPIDMGITHSLSCTSNATFPLIGRSENPLSDREGNDKFLKWNDTSSMTIRR